MPTKRRHGCHAQDQQASQLENGNIEDARLDPWVLHADTGSAGMEVVSISRNGDTGITSYSHRGESKQNSYGGLLVSRMSSPACLRRQHAGGCALEWPLRVGYPTVDCTASRAVRADATVQRRGRSVRCGQAGRQKTVPGPKLQVIAEDEEDPRAVRLVANESRSKLCFFFCDSGKAGVCTAFRRRSKD